MECPISAFLFTVNPRMLIPKSRQALVGCSGGELELVVDLDLPESLHPDQILCKVGAVALNPVDFKISDYSPVHGGVAGFDFAGEVVNVGYAVKRFQIGERVLGISHGQNALDKSTGAFAEYSIAMEDLCCKIPDSMGYEEASTFGVAVATAGCSISAYLGLPLPDCPVESTESCYVLVSGGATSTGKIAVQLLNL